MTRPHRRIAWACLSTVTVVIAPARAQPAPGMDGRANDASNLVGSGGLNQPVQGNFINSANLYVTGNVTAGRAFRGVSPIHDSSVYLGLPSAQLGTFTRDTIGLGDILGGRSAAQPTAPFYLQSNTVTNLGNINSGLNMPGSSVPASTAMIPQANYQTGFRPTPFNPVFGADPAAPVVPNSSLYTTSNFPLIREMYGPTAPNAATDALRQSPIFTGAAAGTRPIGSSEAAVSGTLSDPYGWTPPSGGVRPSEPITLRNRTVAQPTPAGAANRENAAVDNLSAAALTPKLFGPDTGPAASGGTTTVGTTDWAQPWAIAGQSASGSGGPGIGSTFAAQVAAGFEASSTAPYARLSAAVQALENAPAEPQPLEEGGAPAEPGLLADARIFITSMSEQKAKSLAASGLARVDEYVGRAEELVRQGDYYKASILYKLASQVDPTNPMVRLGHGHALLAAGEYLTAVYHLTSAIGDYPAFPYLNIDLNVFITDPTVLDIRRADLEARLRLHEDYRLRFLLGYTEYYSGLPQFGLPDLRRAAEQAPPDSVIARFPSMLTGKKVVP